MKKAVIFYPHIGEYGGIERNIVGLAIKAHEMGLYPTLVCFYDRIGMSKYSSNLETVALGDSANPLKKSIKLQRWLHRNKDDIAGLPLFFSGKAGFYAAVQQARPYPYALHFTDPLSLLRGEKQAKGIRKLVSMPRTKVSNWLIRQGVKKASLRLTMTQWNATELQSDYNYDFQVIHQGGVPPEEAVRREPRCMSHSLRLFSICRLTYSKNLHWILLAAKRLSTEPPFNEWYKEVKVIIAGKGPEEDKLRTLAAELGLSDQTNLPGFLEPREVEEQYRRADLFLVPGKQGFGLPILEALYRRVPVIQNKESRISELLTDNPWVKISEDNAESFVEAVCAHVTALRNHYPDEEEIQDLQTEDRWAAEIGQRCHWW